MTPKTQGTEEKINWAIKFENLLIRGVMIHWANLRWKVTMETNFWNTCSINPRAEAAAWIKRSKQAEHRIRLSAPIADVKWQPVSSSCHHAFNWWTASPGSVSQNKPLSLSGFCQTFITAPRQVKTTMKKTNQNDRKNMQVPFWKELRQRISYAQHTRDPGLSLQQRKETRTKTKSTEHKRSQILKWTKGLAVCLLKYTSANKHMKGGAL